MQARKGFSIWRYSVVMPCLLLVLSIALPAYNANSGEPANDEEEVLTLGYFPLISTVALFKRFAPLRDYLAESLGRPVILQTAKDFSTFLERSDDRAYDILVTAPHFAVRASDSGEYRIRATLVENVQQLVVVREDSKITHLTELAGKKVSTPPRRALMTMMGVQYMIDAGLAGDQTPIYLDFTSHNAANEAVLAKEVDAAIASSNIIRKAIERGDSLRIISLGLQLPNMATMVAMDLDDEIGERLVGILLGMNDSEKGREALKRIRFTGYRRVNDADYEAARPYLRQGTADLRKTN